MSTELKTERFLVDGYVMSIFPRISRDGRPMWVVTLDLIDSGPDDALFEFASYYEPTFVENDRIRIGISRRGESTISSCAPFIVQED